MRVFERRKRSRIGFIVFVTSCVLCCRTHAESNFVTVPLSKNVTADLPKNWSVMSDNKRITLDSWRESVMESLKLPDADHDMPFAATYYDEKGSVAGTMLMRCYPDLRTTQSDADAGGKTFLADLDAGVRQIFSTGLEAGGGKMVEWLGTVKTRINGSVYFVSGARTLSPQGNGFRVSLVRYLNAGKSFTVIVTHREDQAFYLKPICDKIVASIRTIDRTPALAQGRLGRVYGYAASGGIAVEQGLVKKAAELNKQLPMLIEDGNVRVDKVTAGPGRRMTYHYTLVKLNASDVDMNDINTNAEALKQSVCADASRKEFFKANCKISYSYRSRDGAHITTLDITPSDYGFIP